ncbi:uncharacterized protein TRIADDRAFT_30374 [Trichoplax adhaerens]|uniref:G-protein coupled receptors family 3 profile domain-containing protein n=1 Tax=Trichoplax adhaerens TaxID=10228 RepID=B3S736_TRIAD|nr:hypothetical protein TRIADDRAFT_30374 [Trichoplax adhaerens]EDV21504.1 hypothetical protein TRIADDRAFT_30374 [Trichoplax adhaerens]|eukprot:XP_002116104.1 hypothetical protein TRIADDRAFT_30374 [Trichoplax adhaerens]
MHLYYNHIAVSKSDGHAPAVIIPHAIIAIQISSSAFATIASLCILGICLALICLGFNIVKRKHRFIKMSSPNINNLLTIGCIICYVAIILFGVDTNFMASVNLPIIYAMRVWFLCIGFTIAFGSLFVKTWRVYRIFNNKTGRKIIIRDGSLIRAVMQLVLIDVAILLIWLLVDPYKLKQQTSFVYEPITIAGTSYRGKEIIQYTCTSTHSILWLAVIYSYKGLLMLFGAYLAFATRRVAIEALNDSQYIAVCIYQVTILSMISVAISFITSTNVDLSYMLFSGMSLLCVTSVLCIVFIPKVILNSTNDFILHKSAARPCMSCSRDFIKLLSLHLFNLKNSAN